MIDDRFVVLGAAFSFLGGVSYLRAVLKGRAKPNRVTWFIWALAPMIAMWSELHQGVGLAALMTFMVGFSPLMVFVASFFNRQAYWKLTGMDAACGGLAVLGLILWQLTSIANLAILFSLLADTVVLVPTLLKSYHFPETENASFYLGGGLAGLTTLLTIDTWNFAQYAFPAYILISCAVLYVLIKFEVGKKLRRA